eukprot:TRINITY_DN73625_c0_g1_i1.p1 TRINITY_DN73625_c0_g1~~TRINITY_DN73625_c0_g1_i1.p1  ORF type:complete len:1111 (-),score=203.10 TRINITY_DN73625_c0_g1_i1:61-3219(-)
MVVQDAPAAPSSEPTAAEGQSEVISVGTALRLLDSYTKGAWTWQRSVQIRKANLRVAFRVASWLLILASPVFVYPIAHYLHTRNTEREFLAFWGSMLLQFLFCVGPTLGATIKYTFEGLFGTILAMLNMVLLNNVLSGWMHGGSFAEREIVPLVGTALDVVRSRWLPLCSDGALNKYGETEQTSCFMNVNWAGLDDAHSWKAVFVLLDVIVFTALVLLVGFNTNTRMFALSTHVYFAMTFLNPDTGSFSQSPSLHIVYATIVIGASAAVILTFILPCPITALSEAQQLASQAVPAATVILEALPFVTAELPREKLQSALEELELVLADQSVRLKWAWFEDFGLTRRADRRRRLQAMHSLLQDFVRCLPALQHAAAAVPRYEAHVLADALPSLRFLCARMGSVLASCNSSGCWQPDARLFADAKRAKEEFSAEFSNTRNKISPAGLVFACMVSGACGEFYYAAKCLLVWKPSQRMDPQPWSKYLATAMEHFEFKLRERSATHPRFVLRNTLTIAISFVLGWVGIKYVTTPYSSTPASTVSVIMYTFAGASVPITLRRFNGVVVGMVIGSMANRLLAIKTPVHAAIFACALWGMVFFFVFQMLHSKQHGAVSCLIISYMVSFMMGSGLFREESLPVNANSGSALYERVAQMIVGTSTLLAMDLLLSSSARRQSRRFLKRSLRRVKELMSIVICSPEEDSYDGDDRVGRALINDLNDLSVVLPQAELESDATFVRFYGAMHQDLEQGIRRLAQHLRAMNWALGLHVKKPKIIRAGTAVFASSGDADLENDGHIHGVGAAEKLFKDASFLPILSMMEQEFQRMLDNVLVLVNDLTSVRVFKRATDTEKADEVRAFLQQNLYSRKAVATFQRSAVSPWKAVKRLKANITNGSAKPAPTKAKPIERSMSNPDLELQALSTSVKHPNKALIRRSLKHLDGQKRQSKVETIVQTVKGTAQGIKEFGHQVVVEEDAGDESWPLTVQLPVTELGPSGAKQGVADNSPLRLLLMFESMRKAVLEHRGDIPQNDPLTLVEVVIFFLGSVISELQKMQVCLLEYS